MIEAKHVRTKFPIRFAFLLVFENIFIYHAWHKLFFTHDMLDKDQYFYLDFGSVKYTVYKHSKYIFCRKSKWCRRRKWCRCCLTTLNPPKFKNDAKCFRQLYVTAKLIKPGLMPWIMALTILEIFLLQNDLLFAHCAWPNAVTMLLQWLTILFVVFLYYDNKELNLNYLC